MKKNTFGSLLIMLVAFILACTSSASIPPLAETPTSTPVPTNSPPTLTPTSTVIPLPEITLAQGDRYFTFDGQESFFLSRNPTGKTQADFDNALDWTHQGGSKIIRVHLTHGWWGDDWINHDGSPNPAWIADWENFFDQAEADGIYLIPVFGVWADWNNGTPDYKSPFWKYNPLNTANGGSIQEPGELFKPDSETQQLWLKWMGELVKRWQGRKNIVAWEIFSEINIASALPEQADATGGPNVDVGIEFTRRAAEVIEKVDPGQRPITLSLAGTYDEKGPWGEYYSLDVLDFIEVHPYSDRLDRELVSGVGEKLARYDKPVFIGESGLWAYTHEPKAMLGIQHAIWAGLVSGAMNGRSLWDQDGYAIYFYSNRRAAIQFMQAYARAELPAAKFASGHDFSGYKPLQVFFPKGTEVWGAAIGNENTAIGWFRDAKSEAPNWSLQPVIQGQTITLEIPGAAKYWRVDFYDTKNGTNIIHSTTVENQSGQVTINLPDFQDDLAFKMSALFTLNPIAGRWVGEIYSTSGLISRRFNWIYTMPVSLEPPVGPFPHPNCPAPVSFSCKKSQATLIFSPRKT